VRAAIGLPRHLVAGVLLACLELLLVVTTGQELFLSWVEIGRYALLALTLLPASCALFGLIVEGAIALLREGGATEPRTGRRLRVAVFALSVPLCAWAAWSLTSGRRVRDLAARPLLVALSALLAAYLLATAARAVARTERGSPKARAWSVALCALVLASLALDMHVLRRLYPAFHLSLSALALSGALASVAVAELPAKLKRLGPGRAALASALCLLGTYANVRALSAAPNARFAIVETAPLSGKLLKLARVRVRSDSRGSQPASVMPNVPAAPAQPGIDLRKGDVLLITIDALRADQLRAYGGNGLTPTLDALAAQSVVFLHAYTPTPHTSYALSSLMTGKFMQPLLSLAESSTDQPTLATLLRRQGYRTAAFYPPAIFFVDGERFDRLRKDQLGFEYVKAMFAPAAERVPQLEAYLRAVDPGHPLFVWVHLFEPHEPYEPLPQFACGDTPFERYQGEVAAADAAVAGLVAAFRRARPAATVIVSADHGEEFGDHGGHHHGTTLYDEQVHVPLLWSSPGKTRPGVVSAPVELIDLPTSLLAAFGIPRDVRMRGDDLGPLLLGAPAPPSARAFALIDGARMVTDGSAKLICGEEEDCRLFDLGRDPRERRDIAQERPEQVAALRAELNDFMASIPRVEALALRGGGAWPDALARARLGDASAAPELVPLLDAARADVRAAAARAAGELSAKLALAALSRMRETDPDPAAKAEAAIAALRLGDTRASAQVAALLPADSAQAPAADLMLARRAALALAERGDAAGVAILLAAARDQALDEAQRLQAIRALGGAGGADATEGLLPLLADVRLRPTVAETLGRSGNRGAVEALFQALSVERYPLARRAEARALLALGARDRAVELTRRFLGTDSSLPDGVGILLDAGALAHASGQGAEVAGAPGVRRGPWECVQHGCRPLAGAALVLPSAGAPRASARVVLRASSGATGRSLRVSGTTHYLDPGTSELAISIEHARGWKLALEAEPGVLVQALAVVPVQDDIPPPPPEPWTNDAQSSPTH
jgi:arylsulfatase A-like enzyme